MTPASTTRLFYLSVSPFLPISGQLIHQPIQCVAVFVQIGTKQFQIIKHHVVG